VNKKEFLNRLKDDLSSLTDDERQNAIKYYEEYFDEAAEESKGEMVSQFVSPEDLAKKIEAELAELAKAESAANETVFEMKTDQEAPKASEEAPKTENIYNQNKSSGTWKIVLLLCTAPVWLPVLIGLASAAFGLFMGLLGIAFAIAAIALSGFIMVGAGFMAVGYGAVNLFIDVTRALYPLGAGFVVAGVGLILGYTFTKLTALMFKSQFKFLGWALRGITGRFSRQGA